MKGSKTGATGATASSEQLVMACHAAAVEEKQQAQDSTRVTTFLFTQSLLLHATRFYSCCHPFLCYQSYEYILSASLLVRVVDYVIYHCWFWCFDNCMHVCIPQKELGNLVVSSPVCVSTAVVAGGGGGGVILLLS